MRFLSIPIMLAMLSLASYSTIVSADVKQDIQPFIDKGDFKGALNIIEQGLNNDATNQKLLLAKGYLLVKLDQLDAATEYYKILKAHLTDNPEPGNNLAMIYRMQGKYDLAVQTFTQIIEAFPDYAHAYENLGDTYIEMAQHKYQAGFDSSGKKSLQKKVALSQNFHQIALESSARSEQKDQQFPNATDNTAAIATKTSSTSSASEAAEPLPADVAESKQNIAESIESWTNDWMSRDADRYLSHYSDKFTPGKDEPLARWIERKKKILSNAASIKLKLSNLDIKLDSDNKLATAIFKQEYESSNFRDISKKTLHLEQNKGRWLILKEVSESA